ncbi:hypothetical protein [Marinobacterium stanieri]|uniref:Uncharacterized protein n=1 Tax=Marinobacterium stanieri TaxID=49186 RepID=A0A1N6SB53_9GAMM|nr:hypothetical protein [Marinobacterium stanieri]SIQ38324.1 hypothetical protein SAMN05421647_104151 [Marinobacterium stanieri]
MYEALYLFLATGVVSMAAALSAGALNKLPEEKRPAFMQSRNGQVAVIMAGNLGALTLVGAMAYGFRQLDWWIPLSCLLLTFPLVHQVLLQRLLGDVKTLVLTMPLVIAAIFALYFYW